MAVIIHRVCSTIRSHGFSAFATALESDDDLQTLYPSTCASRNIFKIQNNVYASVEVKTLAEMTAMMLMTHRHSGTVALFRLTVILSSQLHASPQRARSIRRAVDI